MSSHIRSGLAAALVQAAVAVAVPESVAADAASANSVANSLKICLRDHEGFRDGPRAADLATAVEVAPGPRWTVTPIGDGLFRLTGSSDPTVIDIKVPDVAGSAHCLAFGAKMQPGDAPLVADRFVELGYIQGFVAAEPAEGMSRRYVMPGLPFQMELVSYEAEGFGQVVGLTFAGVTGPQEARKLADAGQVAPETALAFLGWTLQTCIQTFGNTESMRAALEAGGFEFGHADGRQEQFTYFLPDNSVSATVGSYTCNIDTNQVGVGRSVPQATSVLNQSMPGQFQQNERSTGGCIGYYRRSGGDQGPLNIYVGDLANGRGQSCVEDGTTRIRFEIPG